MDDLMKIRLGQWSALAGNAGQVAASTPPIIGTPLARVTLDGSASASGVRGAAEVSAETGKIGLGMLSILIVGMMGFYIATRSRQL